MSRRVVTDVVDDGPGSRLLVSMVRRFRAAGCMLVETWGPSWAKEKWFGEPVGVWILGSFWLGVPVGLAVLLFY
jgi:hypothetical protein